MNDSVSQFLLTYPNLADPDGEVVFENEHVVLQRLVVGPGEWEGIHSHPGNQLYVHVKGGLWSGREHGEVTYVGPPDADGSVGWMDAIPLSEEHDSGNVGDELIDLIYVTLKRDMPIAPGIKQKPQTYPNIRMELLLENDRMIVQRGQVEPGQSTGVHSHPGNQICIHIKGGTWLKRRVGVREVSEVLEAGSVGWIDAAEQSEAHEFANIGDMPIDFVLVTLK
jgi:quercetin dioxygenase-like cupin family protein